MGFNIINIQFNHISYIKDNGYNSDISYNFNLSETLGFMIVNIPSKVSYQKVTK